MYRIFKVFLKLLKGKRNRRRIDNSKSFKIGIIYVNEIELNESEVLQNTFVLLNRDHELIDLGFYDSNKISAENFTSTDFNIIIGCRARIPSKLIKILNKIKNPLVFISTNNDSEICSKMNSFDLLLLRDFDKVSRMSKEVIALHGLAFSLDKTLFFESNYLYSQLRTGINLLKRNQTKVSNRIISKPNLKVGFNSFHNGNFQVRGDVHAEVGSFCSFGKNISLYTVNHDIRFATTQGFLYREYFKQVHPGAVKEDYSRYRSKGPIIIKNDVWIGDDVKIMSGVTLGNGACVAAGSIVTNDVGDYEIVAGIPAKKINMRFKNPEVVKLLLESKWWHWNDCKILDNIDFFQKDLISATDLDSIKIT
ncbi:chloramphenicol acetyltransferase [Nonlabens ulvanivorans]|uniref:Chloramphenicol acetyltransferase n=1 Tax=Nonlabens ulvanivorans TaxID=906888 RepID=A0A090WFK1_NONUL|nr:CatB-related O-acetyltransferase [Nonlabens ulvanivorans]GAL74968.1 chloramphenicol acetyltransferase [Nonlabens ulvanivorans]